MTGLAYLTCIALGCLAMLALDRRFALYLFARPRRALLVQTIGVATFLLWDAVCIALGVFQRGTGPFTTGLDLAPELPLEEPFFLWFLCHFTMVVATGAPRVLAAARRRRTARTVR